MSKLVLKKPEHLPWTYICGYWLTIIKSCGIGYPVVCPVLSAIDIIIHPLPMIVTRANSSLYCGLSSLSSRIWKQESLTWWGDLSPYPCLVYGGEPSSESSPSGPSEMVRLPVRLLLLAKISGLASSGAWLVALPDRPKSNKAGFVAGCGGCGDFPE